jgi:uncharacterized protein YcfL
MKKIKGFLIYICIPLAIIILLLYNAKYQSDIVAQSDSSVDLNQVQVEYSVGQTEYEADISEEFIIPVTLNNTGTMTWIADSSTPIYVSYHIYDTEGNTVEYEGERTEIPVTIRPDESGQVDLLVIAPEESGDYIVSIDMVYEGVGWFSDNEVEPLSVDLTVR